MRLSLEINNITKNRLDEKIIRQTVLATLEKSGLKSLGSKKISVSLAFVSPTEIRKLNRIYRKKYKVTDILSFAEYKNQADLKKERKNAIFLGELVVCPEYIRNYARKSKLNFKNEMDEVIVHGILHLLGFSHSKKMFSLQERIINKKEKK